MTKRLIVYCEGQTEEMIVERLIRNHLLTYGVKVEPPILAANSLHSGSRRGGFVNWDAIDFDLRQIFKDNACRNLRFTTFLDVYAIPEPLLQLANCPAPLTAESDVLKVEKAIETHFNENRFKAYLQRHEMEALLLADLSALERVFARHSISLKRLRNDICNFHTAEDINDGPETHPSARLAAAIPGYAELKASNAYFVLAESGLDSVRSKCPRFDAWLKHWETWGMET